MSFSLATLIHHFGALGVSLGAGIEGETAVVIGGIAAHHGLFSPIAAWLAAWFGSFTADQCFFFLGRWRRGSRWVRAISAKPAFGRAIGLIERSPIAYCIAFRFIYGMRVAGPVAIGLSNVRPRLYRPLNFISAGVWSATFTALGFIFGHAVEIMLRRAFSPLHIAILAVLVSVAAISIWLWRNHRKAQSEDRNTVP
jgi:membrane protein DedA with SNARE-associated domain